MDIDLFFKKVYTVAFRLTGEEQIAEETATQAIIYIFKRFETDAVAKGYAYRLSITAKVTTNGC